MASIGTLQIDFAASVARLEKDVKSAAKSVKQAAGEIEGAVSFAKNAIIAMAGALGVGTFLGAIREAGAMADAAAKMGDRFGLATEMVVGLQHAADLSGLTNLENALKTMTEKVGEAANKSGEARDALFANARAPVHDTVVDEFGAASLPRTCGRCQKGER